MEPEKKISPTAKELEILQVLWSNGEATVREVHEELSSKNVGYTTTLKLMQLMHEKGYLTRTKEGRVHTYQPVIQREQIQTNLLGKFVDSVFQGSTSRLVMHAIGNKKTTKQEIDDIRLMLDKLEQEN